MDLTKTNITSYVLDLNYNVQYSVIKLIPPVVIDTMNPKPVL